MLVRVIKPGERKQIPKMTVNLKNPFPVYWITILHHFDFAKGRILDPTPNCELGL
jgi:hypothetical protein